MAQMARKESAEHAALRVCNEMKEMIMTAKMQAAAVVGKGSLTQHGAVSSASGTANTDADVRSVADLKTQEELEDTKRRLNQALTDLAIAQREIEAKDKQIVALLSSRSKEFADEKDLRDRLQQEQVTSEKLRKELASVRVGKAVYDA